MDVELVENLGCDVVVIPQEREKEMFRADYIGFIKFGFEIGDLENLLACLVRGILPMVSVPPEVRTVSSIAFFNL